MEGVFVFLEARAWLKTGLGWVAEFDRVFAGVRSALVLVRLFDQIARWDDPLRDGVLPSSACSQFAGESQVSSKCRSRDAGVHRLQYIPAAFQKMRLSDGSWVSTFCHKSFNSTRDQQMFVDCDRSQIDNLLKGCHVILTPWICFDQRVPIRHVLDDVPLALTDFDFVGLSAPIVGGIQPAVVAE